MANLGLFGRKKKAGKQKLKPDHARSRRCRAISAIQSGTLQVRLVATPYCPRVSLGTRLGASDFVAADAGPENRASQQAPNWTRLGRFPVGEPHLRGAYHGNPSTPHDQAIISIEFSCLPALPASRRSL